MPWVHGAPVCGWSAVGHPPLAKTNPPRLVNVLVDGPELVNVVAGDVHFADSLDVGLGGAAGVLVGDGLADLLAEEVPGGFGLIERQGARLGRGARVTQVQAIEGAQGADQFGLVGVGEGCFLAFADTLRVVVRRVAERMSGAGVLIPHDGCGAIVEFP